MREWEGPPYGPKIRPQAGSIALRNHGTKLRFAMVGCNCGRVHTTWWKTTPPPGCKSAAP